MTKDYGLRITNNPNPFTESATFSYTLKESSPVILQIYNSFGQLLAEPLNTTQIKGDHQLQWNATNLPSGMYYYRIQAGSQTGSGKMVKY
jgi:flagellar hook assembly protein FlgD